MARTKATAIALAFVAFVFGAAAAGVVAFGACVPDLATFTLSPVPTPTAALCGNGFIDLDAGEQCDPGEGGAVGCTGKCAIECADGGGFVDDASNHCYFAIATPLSYPNAKLGCGVEGAHVTTFVSPEELQSVRASIIALDASFWVGIEGQSAQGWTAVNNEPGWAAGCRGCYAEHVDAAFFNDYIDGATPPCVAVYNRQPAPWLTYYCGSALHTLCEREPLGSTAQACNGGTCIDIRRTLGQKRYLYIATHTDPDAADKSCQQVPAGSLVIFESREEREQLWRELVQITAEAQLWIGLSRPSVDAGANEWTWADGVRVNDPNATRPNPWGDGQPSRTVGAALRAYSEVLEPNIAVDSQLARNVDRAVPSNTPSTLPYLCQFKPE